MLFSINSLFANLIRCTTVIAIFILLPGKVLQAQEDSVDHCIKYSSDTDSESSLNADIFLMISSFNPDTKRTMDFITDFERQVKKLYKNNFVILIEDLGVKNFNEEAHLWKERVSRLLAKYERKNVAAIIAIGQEAWSAISSQESLPKDIPILGAFISSNGIDLPQEPINPYWEPGWINMSRKIRAKATAGGVVNVYNAHKNIELIQTLFPETENVVFITDNTYGGISLKALFKRSIPKLPPLNYIFLDSREHYLPHMKEIIRDLPQKSALLIATWRVNKDGQYYLGNSLEDLISGNPHIPVFSMSGTGIGSVAIGGFIPIYRTDALTIVKQIIAFHNGERDSVTFVASGGVYQFDRKKLDNLSIKDYRLPPESNIVNTSDPRIEKYKRYIYGISGVAFILIILIITFSILYGRNKRLRKRLEENSKLLQEAKERAEESDRLKSAFLANMSHEIRTPLNAIVGFSNLLTEEEFSGQERKDMSSVITQNSKLLLTLITDILDFSGLETGKLNFVFKETDLNAICEQVLATISHLRKNDVEYRFEPGSKEIIIRTDSHRLSQVLLNLLTNANKFTDRGSIVLKYEVVKKDKGYLLFSVTDTGTGIPREQHKLLFERFGKLNNFKQGAGLGLAISKQIIARLGGKIWIDSDYSDGARFFFTHPF
ncbi:MAG: two-component sensor histidine kinase [Bacteroidetes bacterium HGW-Bacteroidetes-8]|nr:MAG: two-component sensor histidine kinase [Bacteroidetes bacterium HGW-Bacteroidetes-8]